MLGHVLALPLTWSELTCIIRDHFPICSVKILNIIVHMCVVHKEEHCQSKRHHCPCKFPKPFINQIKLNIQLKRFTHEIGEDRYDVVF